ncbi:MAG: cation transporter [Bdellovibrionales bacterium RIFOXYB1_FULL_37_110]|nr:MAG: cation transporter [Bdellovibrionales bacterium RIFOXYA1_FULL_38_20]OFZ52009.1 MAG: cation transporter [Bdellovibrionales bacterium RIFOXYC1_FULL_37_79]OFZ60587.1 MAG: cation transporter [Bdellovibrionales bacterium RIFOXYB1_FULL_37_110]OFZ61778.1 MAG: cation transporter [Bdellovibrionales bacterium RIFOXYD1_FULL_36_51]
MIEKIIDFSINNRFLVFVGVILLTIAGWTAMKKIPIDAIPDLSDTQVIIYTQWDRSPDIIEDQVTYPIISALLGAPKVKDIRGFSDFGFSYVYVIFQDGTDPYWARSRVMEYLSKIDSSLPAGAKTQLGPDATGVGWVFQYALKDTSGKHSLAELRTMQDWFLKYVLSATPGVAEVASLGGFQKEYQIKLNPSALQIYKIPLPKIIAAVKSSNNEIGARVLEIAGAEYMIRARGYIKNVLDIENIVVDYDNGTPIYIKNIAQVALGPQMRRGVSDLDGMGDAVGGIVIIRHGENANTVIEAVKEKLNSVKASLPPEIEIVTTYDRSDLIKKAIGTLTHELLLEMIIVSLVIFIFLMHIPSSLIPVITMPLAVLISFIPMYFLGISANIMSLGGIAIAIGAMVDAAIVVVENTHKHLEEWDRSDKSVDKHTVIVSAIKEVAPASFYSLLVIAVAFIPIFVLEAQEGKLFKPLAYTKNLSMIVAAILAITLDPALRVAMNAFTYKELKPLWWSKLRNTILVGKIHPEDDHPLSKFFFKLYGPIVYWVVEHRYKVVISALMIMLLTVPVFFKLGAEFMPPLNEGTILYMPTTMPGISVKQAQELLIRQDQVLKSFPEVERVFGKAGRADTATDPAPFSMMETTVILKDQRKWREQERWYSFLPRFMQWPFAWMSPRFMSYEELIAEMDSKTKFPGTTNAWTMPIRNRIDMLTTGIRTPVGIKVMGNDLAQVEKTGIELEKAINNIKGTRSVFAERVTGGYFLDFHFDREKLARYGITVGEAQDVLMSAIGGEPVTTTIEGRERYSVNIRYSFDYRKNPDTLKKILLSTPKGAMIPLGEVAHIEMLQGPAMLRNENGLLTSYVYIDLAGIDIGTYVRNAKEIIHKNFTLPSGITLVWSGQFENMQRVAEKLTIIVPITLCLILLLLYANTKSWIKTAIIITAVPFSAIGAICFLYLLGYNMSIAVWVGLIALLGVDAETGIFMLLYLDLSYETAKNAKKMNSFNDLKEAIHNGSVKRIRPKVMTVGTLLIALLPIMFASTADAGADVMKRIAAPMLGGVITSFAMELLVYPAIFAIWKWNYEMNKSV